MATDVAIQNLAKSINASWRKTAECVLDTAKLCSDANTKLSPDERKKLVQQLDCGEATFSKLAKIGSRPQLQVEPLKGLLPPSYSIVYELAKLEEADLDDAVNDGVITPRMTRGELLAWVAQRNGKALATDDEEHCPSSNALRQFAA